MRETFRASAIGRSLTFVSSTVRAAWESSALAAPLRAAHDRSWSAPIARRVRFAAIAVAVAAVMQPLLRLVMPATVAPAGPAVACYLVIGVLAVVAAWKAGAVAAAWPSSRLARLLN